MFLADFHLHSTFSDGKLTIPELVDLYGERGFGAIGITDHLCEEDTFFGRAAVHLGQALSPATYPIYREILRTEAARAWRQYRMVVLTGIEFSKNSISNHHSAHIIGLGLDDYIPTALPTRELCARIREQGGVTIAAHPVSTRRMEKQTLQLWGARESYRDCFDAWEVASGRVLFDEVLRSGLPMIASSDLHVRKQLTSWKTVFECDRDPAAILAAIRAQELSFQFYAEEDSFHADLPRAARDARLARHRLVDLGRARDLWNVARVPALGT